MGDRYTLNKDCIYCKHTNNEIWYAPTCNSMTFDCEKCGAKNFLTIDFQVKKLEDVAYEDVYNAINDASTRMDDKMIKSEAKYFYNKLRGLVQ